MAPVRGSGWLPNTVANVTNELASTEAEEIARGRRGGEYRSQSVFGSRRGGIESRPRRQVSISLVHDPGEVENKANIGLHKNQHRLDGKDRPQGRLYRSTSAPELKVLSIFRTSTKDLPIQSTPIRYEHCATCIFQAHAIRFRTLAETRCTDGVLSRRHLCRSSEPKEGARACKQVGKSSAAFRFPHQLEKECIDTHEETDIPGVCFRLTSDEDQGTFGEDGIITTTSTSSIEGNTFESLDCELVGEDNQSHSSCGRCTTSLPIHTEGLRQESTASSSLMGKTVSFVSGSQERSTMVDGEQCIHERSTNSNTTANTAKDNNSCGCFGFWLGSDLPDVGTSRFLESRGKTFDQCTGAEDHQDRIRATRNKVQKLSHPTSIRQHHSPEVCVQARRHSISHVTTRSIEDSAHPQHISNQRQPSTHCRDQQHESGSFESITDANPRENAAKEVLQHDQTPLEDCDNGYRCIRSCTQPSTETILELPGRQECRSGGCFQPRMADKGIVPESTVEIDSQGVAQISRGSSQVSDSSHSLLAHSTLVSHGHETQQDTTVNIENHQENFNDRLALIKKKQAEDGLSVALQEFLMNKVRDSTNYTYNTVWRRWVQWCVLREKNPNPQVLDVKTVAQYLLEMQCRGVSVSHLNTTRSSLVSVFKVYHPVVGNLSSYPLIQDTFNAARRKEVKLPNTSSEIWDIETLVMLVKSWGNTEDLSLTRLQQKTMVLLAVASMWRIRSDIGRLQWRDVQLHEGLDGTYEGLTLLVRTPKECQAKVSKIGPLSDLTICPVHTTAMYMQRTKDLRMEMDDDHTFFFGYVEDNSKTRSIRPATAASWLKSIMIEAKIDVEKYPPHSIRAAAATKAVIQGIPIQDIKLHANWGLNTDTMERYYLRPPNQHQRGQHICEAIFSHNTDNNSTSEVEGVSTVIGIEPTTADQEVDTDGTQDVLGARPWKKLSRFFNQHVFSFLYHDQ